MKNKMKINLFFVKNRHCICGIVTLIALFILLLPMASYAADSISTADVSAYGGNGSYELDGTLASHFNLSTPYPALTWDNMCADYDGDVSNIIRATNFSFVQHDTDLPDLSSIYNPSSNYGGVVPVSVSADGNNLSLNTGAYYLFAYSFASAGTQKFYINYRFYSPGHVAYIDTSAGHYVVSDQPLQFIWTRGMLHFNDIVTVSMGNIDVPKDNGLYCFALDNTPVNIYFTDVPVYQPSTDGASGFTTFTNDSTDFSFSADNYNFNTLLRDEIIEDPNGSDDQPSIVDPDGAHYNYAYASPQFDSFGNNGIYCKWSFVLNDYMKLHPQDYKFHAVYTMTFKDSTGNHVFNVEHTPYVSDILSNNDANYVTSDLFRSFLNVNDNSSMSVYLQNVYNSVSNTSGFYTEDSVITYDNSFWIPGSYTEFKKFDLGVREIFRPYYTKADFSFYGYFEFLGDPREESGRISGSYNLLTGDTSITQNDISKNLNPPSVENPQYPQELKPSSGINGALNSAVATIQSGAIQLYTGGNAAGFQMSQQDWNKFGMLLGEMKNDLTVVNQDHGVMSAMSLVKNVTEGILPTSGNENTNKIWLLIYAGVAGSIVIALWNKAAHNH